jgi:hypothetical protein
MFPGLRADIQSAKPASKVKPSHKKLVDALPRGPFLDFHAHKPWNAVANNNQDGRATELEGTSIPERIPSVTQEPSLRTAYI